MDKLLLVLSEESMKSNWVKIELGKALKKESELNQTVLFPVTLVPIADIRSWDCIDSLTQTNLAAWILDHNIGDFQNWQNEDAYQNELNRFVRDLKKPNQPLPKPPTK